MPPLSTLPVDSLVPEIVAAMEAGGNAVVVAPPGAGKTTRIPPAIASADSLRGNAVVLLQPRRVAARAAAARIAAEQGWRLGEEVGYHIRFDRRIGPKTRVRVLTEGILTRQIESDPYLEGVGCVILDEFHERSIHTDLTIALLREIQSTVRDDLRIVVMSATMDAAPVAEFLGGAKVFKSEGRLHPVAVEYLDRHNSSPIWEQAADSIRRVWNESPTATGHVLVFLPGISEIRRTAELVSGLGGDLHILHSSVSGEEQDRALRPSKARKLILATNIAETSVTIDGVGTVIDSGFARILVQDSRAGIDRLELRRISHASADQRAGRAGRTGSGRCFRLWTKSEDIALEAAETSEIHRVDLVPTLLAVHAFGIKDLAQFRWFEPPRPELLARADRLLEMLGAIKDGRLTSLGKRMAGLPVHPRLARMLLAGAEAGLPREAATLAALLSEGDIISTSPRRRAAALEAPSDLLERLSWLNGDSPPVALDPVSVRTVLRLADELLEHVKREAVRSRKKETGRTGREGELLRLLLHAYPDRVTVRRSSDPARGVMVGDRSIELEPSSVVRKAPLFLSLDPREVAGSVRVLLASAIEEPWLEEIFPHLCERRFLHRVDESAGRVVSSRRTLFAGLLLREDETGPQADREGARGAMAEYLRARGGEIFARDEDIARWLARVSFLRRAMPELAVPEFDAATIGEAIAEAASGCISLSEVRKRNLVEGLAARLSGSQRGALAKQAPEVLSVPSGNRIRLEYGPGPPVLAVRLQELFGLAETPRVASGRVPVTIQLLAPNHRPVQTTTDLRSFWNGAYQEIRKEFRSKYPKHPWPEDPWKAPAVSVGRKVRR